MTTLVLSSDRKVTNRATASGGVSIKNTFGLPAGKSCPGRTKACDGCYAEAIETRFSAVNRMMESNLAALMACTTIAAMMDMLRPLISSFEAKSIKHNVPAKFRIHWDGDFYSVDYAAAWAGIIREFPNVTFWAYTRSFTNEVNVIPTLADIPNLTLYLSVDEYNMGIAAPMLAKFPSLRSAMLADTMAEGAPIMRELTGKVGAMCPENTKQIPLITNGGTGACVACGICVDGTADVRFSIKKGR